jgi:hypothetical protein
MQSLINGGKTGLLAVSNAFGFKANIYLAAGEVVLIEDGKFYGAPAAKSIAKRRYLKLAFTAGQAPPRTVAMAFTTAEFIDLLDKAEKAFKTFLEVVPNLDLIFKVERERWGQEEVSPQDLKILMALDGQSTVRQVMARCGMPELDVLHTLYRYCRKGLAVQVDLAGPMPAGAYEAFMQDLEGKLADIVGPAAEALIDEAFAAIGVRREFLSEKQVPLLLEALEKHLDQEERRHFKDSIQSR